MICPECKGILKNLRTLERIEGKKGPDNKDKKVLAVYSLLNCGYCRTLYYRNGERKDVILLEEDGSEA
jgi:hypothetical protein